jgi:TRAP-type C4-dicarboxylate transport system permease small subunit
VTSDTAGVGAPPARARVRAPGLRRLAEWLETYSAAAERIARALLIVGVVLCAGTVVVNVFTRYVSGFSIGGYDEVASYAFLWVVWMGVSIAVRRGDVTVITFLTERGPTWWRNGVKTFSGCSLAVLFVYCLVRSTEYATSRESLASTSTILSIPYFYGIASMTLGYYFISLHFLRRVVSGAADLVERGRAGRTSAWRAIIAGAAIGAIVWGI